MKKLWQNSFFKTTLCTLAGMLLGYWLDNISLFTGIGFALGLGYFYIARSDG
ncbi:hypothetical protein MATR_01130 [Marivirga tractuosa]|uniref:Uncharacterized protein n=1 Tax=Marivirga tractuosa (strain ATCC 23168 / DSM 4126 / NBRC 15989 / NCIMB 1408 / VKM B-1430 / H-43) TaxID=643867 RepID=E4TKU2_MARTH|nr:hypothetical protein [Marivirga tractuosa]ADR22245.1 hypothetical protein Ftrac_2266 [Marivirga tractuosa DSM 4126]BDD13288.1 hypothetical protein MATR_01130 [Marivirga tractuosa]